ncbi:NAD(P)-binding protein [Auriscalpium vulgare]|uniref:NAD(P)-binding protein n=1 Tax=Auriscalpium vulgare TaxID=40419 RepID=A0ACB8R5K0_9AGAM|nr:NAD(P)-binding protein [Auriscalpium vulgare]
MFSSSAANRANRALIYSHTGSPSSVLRALTYPALPPPAPGTLNVRLRLAPINPADLNVIEGVYPSRPAPTAFPGQGEVLVGGNEGYAEVQALGAGLDGRGLSVGDWVLVTRQQAGTWRTAANVGADEVIRLERKGLSEVNAATLTVNPATAYLMLTSFVDLKPGDWIIQNGANSAVGQAVIHIARARGVKTLNFVRNRNNLDDTKRELTALGATQVLTYDALEDKRAVRAQVAEWTGGAPVRLALNCVSGPTTTALLPLLGQNAHVVTYGAMSRAPLAIPASAQIFRNLTAHGFWVSRWYLEHSVQEREALMKELVDLKIPEPVHEILTIGKEKKDKEAADSVKAAIDKMLAGESKKKVLLRLEEPDD